MKKVKNAKGRPVGNWDVGSRVMVYLERSPFRFRATVVETDQKMRMLKVRLDEHGQEQWVFPNEILGS